MILFIWSSIHIPHVDNEIIVKNNFIFRGRFILDRLFKDVVISVILSSSVFIKPLLILFIGSIFIKIIVPNIDNKVLIFLDILEVIVLVILISCFWEKSIFSGLIINISIRFDIMFNTISSIDMFFEKIFLRLIYENINDVYFVVDSNFVLSMLYLFIIYALLGEPDIMLKGYM